MMDEDETREKMRIESKREKALLKKVQVLSALVDVRKRILAEASALTGEEQDRVYLGIWSVKDLLAHLTGWDYTNIKAASEVMAGEIPGFYASHDHDWQSYNATLVAKYRRDSLEEAIAQVGISHRQMIEFMQSIPPDVFEKDFGVRFRGFKVTIARLMEAEAKDEETHLEQLVQFRESLKI